MILITGLGFFLIVEASYFARKLLESAGRVFTLMDQSFYFYFFLNNWFEFFTEKSTIRNLGFISVYFWEFLL